MNLVDYKCDSCGTAQEGENGDVPRCPSCGELMRKSWTSAPGIQFKGAGFYVNDYKGQ